jgi:para-nitrobenzyl esterase
VEARPVSHESEHSGRAVQGVQLAAGRRLREWPSPALGGAAHCVDLPFFFDLLDAPGCAEALGPYPPVELAAAMHADLAGFVHGREPGWARATGGCGDPAREYGRPGAALVADTSGVFDPVVRAEPSVRAVAGAVETC